MFHGEVIVGKGFNPKPLGTLWRRIQTHWRAYQRRLEVTKGASASHLASSKSAVGRCLRGSGWDSQTPVVASNGSPFLRRATSVYRSGPPIAKSLTPVLFFRIFSHFQTRGERFGPAPPSGSDLLVP